MLIVVGWNCPGLIILDGSWPGVIYRVAVVIGGNCLEGNCPGGTYLGCNWPEGAIVQGKFSRTRSHCIYFLKWIVFKVQVSKQMFLFLHLLNFRNLWERKVYATVYFILNLSNHHERNTKILREHWLIFIEAISYMLLKEENNSILKFLLLRNRWIWKYRTF